MPSHPGDGIARFSITVNIELVIGSCFSFFDRDFSLLRFFTGLRIKCEISISTGSAAAYTRLKKKFRCVLLRFLT